MRAAALLTVVLLSACRSGPFDPADLEIVAVPASLEDEGPTTYRLLAQLDLGDGPTELWLPLPRSDDYQRVSSLLIQVAPPASQEVLSTAGGDRVLHVTSEGSVRLSWRARVERVTSSEPSPAGLPPGVARVEPRDPAEAWCEALSGQGITARVVEGVELDEGEFRACRWVEVQVDDVWVPIDPTTRRAGLPPHEGPLGRRAFAR